MSTLVKIPRGLYPKPLPVRAVTRFYKLLDSGTVRGRDTNYGGEVAAETVAGEFQVPVQQVWQWVREHAADGIQKTA